MCVCHVALSAVESASACACNFGDRLQRGGWVTGARGALCLLKGSRCHGIVAAVGLVAQSRQMAHLSNTRWTDRREWVDDD